MAKFWFLPLTKCYDLLVERADRGTASARKNGDRDTETAPEAEKAGEGKQVMNWKLLMLTLGQMPVYGNLIRYPKRNC